MFSSLSYIIMIPSLGWSTTMMMDIVLFIPDYGYPGVTVVPYNVLLVSNNIPAIIYLALSYTFIDCRKSM